MKSTVTYKDEPSEDERLAELFAARTEFEAAFRRSASGNLTQHLQDADRWPRLTVFKRFDARHDVHRWHWLIDDGVEPARYSSRGCSTAEFAVGDLWRALTGV